MLRISLLICVLTGLHLSELRGEPSRNSQISMLEMKLMKLYSQIEPVIVSPHRQEVTNRITEVWKEILYMPESFFYPFDSLRFVGKVFSTDSLIRIYTWNLPRVDGTHDYYGFIQRKPEDTQKPWFVELKKGKDGLEGSENKTFSANEWYGCLYYEIVPFELNRARYYLLLALDLNDFFTNRKIIDVLRLEKEEAWFGAPVFLLGRQMQKRVIFEYSSRAVMSLRYDFTRKMIIHDHLSPSQPRYRGQYRFYGPDFSYDGFVFENNHWRQVRDIDISN